MRNRDNRGPRIRHRDRASGPSRIERLATGGRAVGGKSSSISTPDQMARALTHFSARHRELRASHFIIPQVPGSIARSGPIHHVVGSFFKSKKYIAPIFLADPIAGACVAAAYFATGGGRFNPSHDAMVLAPGKEPELPLSPEERRAYRQVLAFTPPSWRSTQSVSHLKTRSQ